MAHAGHLSEAASVNIAIPWLHADMAQAAQTQALLSCGRRGSRRDRDLRLPVGMRPIKCADISSLSAFWKANLACAAPNSPMLRYVASYGNSLQCLLVGKHFNHSEPRCLVVCKRRLVGVYQLSPTFISRRIISPLH